MGVSRGDFNPPHRVAGPSAAPPHAAAYLAAQPDPKPHPRPVKPEGDGLSRALLLEEPVRGTDAKVCRDACVAGVALSE